MARKGKSDMLPRPLEQLMRDLDFPADRREILTYLSERNAPNDTLRVVGTLPEGHYSNVSEVVRMLRAGPA